MPQWLCILHIFIHYAFVCVFMRQRAHVVFVIKNITVLYGLPDEMHTQALTLLSVPIEISPPPTLWEAHLKVKTHLSALDPIKQPVMKAGTQHYLRPILPNFRPTFFTTSASEAAVRTIYFVFISPFYCFAACQISLCFLPLTLVLHISLLKLFTSSQPTPSAPFNNQLMQGVKIRNWPKLDGNYIYTASLIIFYFEIDNIAWAPCETWRSSMLGP